MSRARLLDGLLLAVVLVATVAVRAPGLALPHDRGDQLIWSGVARNIAARGLAGYTLRGLTPSIEPLGEGAAIESFTCVAGRGKLLEDFMASGERYWDSPFIHQPPGYFATLIASHALLGREGDGFPIVARDPLAFAAWRARFIEDHRASVERRYAEIAALPEPRRTAERHAMEEALLHEQGAWERALVQRLIAAPPRAADGRAPWRIQLWATLPALLADLAVAALVFAAALALGGRWAALLAGLAWATDPLAVYCATRLLSNTPLTLATALTLALEAYDASRPDLARGPRRALAVAIGAAAGAAIGFKVSAIFLLPAIAGARLLRRQIGWELALILGLPVLVNAPWLIAIAKFHGNPLGLAWREQPDRDAVSPWTALVEGRSPLYYARSLARSPLVAAGVVAALAAGRRLAAPVAFSLIVLLVAAGFEQKEARHLLLAYPPLVVAASVAIVKLAARPKSPAVPASAAVLLATLLAWQGAAAVGLMLDTASAP